jgi:hypothetical protein
MGKATQVHAPAAGGVIFERNPAVDLVWPDDAMETGLDAALPWVSDALLNGEVDASLDFFALDPCAQFLAVQALRTVARAALRTGAVDDATLVTATTARIRGWLLPNELRADRDN